MITISLNPERTKDLNDSLTLLWRKSVEASHRFLTCDDIQGLIPFVRSGISQIETLVVAYDDDMPIAFIGIDANKIEMLFVASEYFGKGIGKELMLIAIEKYRVEYVDVNEQNPDAAGFYRHLGFKTFERTEHDEQGNPFPILKMRLSGYSIRVANNSDIEHLKNLYRSTILFINRRDYSEAEVEDWAACGDSDQRWKELIKKNYFIVALNRQSQIVGFSSINMQGYLHSMFVHKDFQRMGVATELLRKAERYAQNNAVYKITSEVSITARLFFEKLGYSVETEQKRKADKLYLTNFLMSKMINIEEIALRNQARAYEVIREMDIVNIWQSHGAEINMVGSLRMGLLMKHFDIDFHIYTKQLTIADSFAAISKIAQNPSVQRVEYTNLIDTEECCIEWHVYYLDKDNELWQIDMIHILKGSKYDGYFENVADRIKGALNNEMRDVILKLKYETSNDEKIMGIEYYYAVIKGGVRTYADFIEWRKDNPITGVLEWMP